MAALECVGRTLVGEPDPQVYVDERQLTSPKPRTLTFDQDNHIRDRLSYSVERNGQGRYSFSILDEADEALAIPALVSGS